MSRNSLKGKISSHNVQNQIELTLPVSFSFQCRARLPSAGRSGGPYMEGGRPSRGHATAPHSPAPYTPPTRLPSAGATPRHHQEEQEEMLLVPLRATRRSKRHFDTVMHCLPFLKILKDGDVIKKQVWREVQG